MNAASPDVVGKAKPAPNAAEEEHKSYATQVTYDGYLRKWILPRWRSYHLTEVKAVEVEKWLKTLALLAREAKACPEPAERLCFWLRSPRRARILFRGPNFRPLANRFQTAFGPKGAAGYAKLEGTRRRRL